MHYRNDLTLVDCFPEKNAVRKSYDTTFPNVPLNGTEEQWMIFDPHQSTFDSIDEANAQAILLFIIIMSCFGELDNAAG